MILCPYLKNPEVAKDFEELKQATSEKAAYRIWSLNGGHGIDKAPNGAKSKLFQSLLKYYNGDRTKAIQAKAKTYGTSFLNWFGDWTDQNKENVSKVVDENGEPLVVRHGTTFSNDIKIFSPQTSYFTENKVEADKYGDKFRHPQDNSPKSIPVFLNIRNPHIFDAEGREYRNINDGIFVTFDEFLESHPEYQNESWYWEYQVGEEEVNIPKIVMDAYHNVSTSKTVRTYVSENIGKNNDGVIVKNVLDPADGNVSKTVPITDYVPNSSNQIKHVENQGPTPYEGTYSTENNDIYFQESSIGRISKEYRIHYNTELKLQETEGFNPFGYFKDRNYSVLCEKSSKQFEKYRSVIFLTRLLNCFI